MLASDLESQRTTNSTCRSFPIALRGLNFLVQWPALRQAAALVLQRPQELDRDAYERLDPDAERLAAGHPVAAALLLRAKNDFTLGRARSSRSPHAVRHLQTCAGLDAAISDYGTIESHTSYLARLRKQHRRKDGFWVLVQQQPSG